MIVCLEGIDASGKNTQSRLLVERMGKEAPTKLFTFPAYDTPAGDLVLSHLTERWLCEIRDTGDVMGHFTSGASPAEDDDMLNAVVFQSLQLTNRMELAPQIDEAGKLGNVVMDRYWPSGWVYGAADGLDKFWLHQIHAWLPPADLYLYLEIDPEKSKDRRPDRRDRYEKQKGLMAKAAELYSELWMIQNSSLRRDNAHGRSSYWRVINGEGTIPEVHQRIMESVEWTKGMMETNEDRNQDGPTGPAVA